MKLEHAKELVALAEGKGLQLGSAPCTHLGEAAQTAWRAVREGRIGTPRLAYAELDDGPVHLMDFRDWRSASGAPWPYRDELEMGCTIEHAGYALTWLAAFFGPAESVTAFSTILVPDKGTPDVPPERMAPDFSVACVRFASGPVARLTCSIVAPEDYQLNIIGDRGTLSVDDCRSPRSPVTLAVHVANGRWKTEPATVTTLPLLRNSTVPRASRSAKKVDFCLGPVELVRAIQEKRPSRLTADFACHITELVLAIDKARGGRSPVSLTTTFAPIEPLPWAM
jgi:predicted dehydrogenase